MSADECIARIKYGLARVYVRDLVAWRTDDPNCFGRMVGGDGGKQICFPESFLSNLFSILTNDLVLRFFPDIADEVLIDLARVRLEVPGYDEWIMLAAFR